MDERTTEERKSRWLSIWLVPLIALAGSMGTTCVAIGIFETKVNNAQAANDDHEKRIRTIESLNSAVVQELKDIQDTVHEISRKIDGKR